MTAADLATPLDVARHLAAGLEVVEPATVQAELARIGAELTGHHTRGNESIDIARVGCGGSVADGGDASSQGG